MYRETTENLWSRRALLQGAGLGMLAASGLTSFQPGVPQAWGAGERTRFVSTWNAPDIMDPHVKYDVGAAAFHGLKSPSPCPLPAGEGDTRPTLFVGVTCYEPSSRPQRHWAWAPGAPSSGTCCRAFCHR